MMINTIESLQGLYVALGGDIVDVANITTIPEMLTAISTVAAAAASELPVVKTEDNGMVLTVVSGKWAKAAVPTELPSVSSSDNGKKLLGVSGGKWAKVNIPTPNVRPYTLTDVATNPRLSTTESFIDIVSHIFDGDILYINYEKETNYISCMPIGFKFSNASMSQSSINGVIFMNKYTDNNTVKTVYLTVNSDKTVTIEEI